MAPWAPNPSSRRNCTTRPARLRACATRCLSKTQIRLRPLDLLFEAGEIVSSGRLRLSCLDVTALESMPWLGAALAPEWAAADLEPHVESGRGVLISDS